MNYSAAAVVHFQREKTICPSLSLHGFSYKPEVKHNTLYYNYTIDGGRFTHVKDILS